MIYTIVPVINGNPDLDWAKPPVESFQISDNQRYCIFPADVIIKSSWQIITEAEYLAAKPVIPEPEPITEPTLSDLQAQINDLGTALVQLALLL